MLPCCVSDSGYRSLPEIAEIVLMSWAKLQALLGYFRHPFKETQTSIQISQSIPNVMFASQYQPLSESVFVLPVM